MDTMILASLLDALPDHDAEVRLRQQLVAEAYRDAYRRGYREGYERGARLREADALKLNPNDPSFAELEHRRYGPGGRESWLMEDSPNAAPAFPAPLSRKEAA